MTFSLCPRLLVWAAVVAGFPLLENLASAADQWATLKVKIIYDGPAPKLNAPLAAGAVGCAVNMANKRMIVAKGGELANVAFIMDMRKSKVTDIHPTLVNPPEKAVVVDSIGCLFVPRVSFVRAGQPVTVRNLDPCGHNVKLDPFSSPAINQIIPIAGKMDLEFAKPERSNTTRIACTIHPWMVGHLIIRDHPYVGISGKDGVMTIEKLPVGSVTFKMDHENAVKSLDAGKLDGKKQKWGRGLIKVDLKPGMNDLGTITLDPKLFRD